MPHHESSSEEKFGYFLGAAAASLLVGWTRPKLLLNMRRSRFFLTGLKYDVHFLYDGRFFAATDDEILVSIDTVSHRRK